MAQYRVKRLKDGNYQVWARFTPFKGASTKSRAFVGNRKALPATAMQAAEWVAKQRAGRVAAEDSTGKAGIGGS